MPLPEIEATHSGDMVSRLTNDISVVQGFFQNEFSNIVYQPIVFLVTAGYLATLNWLLLLFAVALVPLTMFFINIMSKPLSQYVKNRQEGFGQVNAVAQDTIGGIYMLKAFNLEQALSEKFKVAVHQVRDYELMRQQRLAVMTTLFVVIRQIPVLSTAACGGYLALTGRMTPGSVFAFMYLLHYLVQPLTNGPYLIEQLRAAAGTAERIVEMMHRPVERPGGRVFAADPAKPAIRYDDVSFSYREQAQVLDGVSFSIRHNRTVALVGHSGSGKSTVLKLLCGFYEPQSGRVELHGGGLGEWNLEALRTQLALVAQDTYLFPASIADNISYGRSGATTDEIVEAARMANAHRFITELPAGYDTLVGERGNRLSGGERQRIGIARAILKNAPILLLDEPTSALDVHSEALIQEALERFMQGRTVLVIAHRLSTIKHADEILVLDSGRVVESGTHEELIARGGVYRQLYLKQFESDDVAAEA
jgi:subfamily B ATP-binding cassette protein MsbA/ATP-binding cassette subfamily B protein AbcA/BmrA